MLTAFTLSSNRLSQIQWQDITVLHKSNPVWLDVIAPTAEERRLLEQTWNVHLPKPEHLHDIEASARFFEEHGEVHLCSDFLLGTLSDSRSVTVAFVLTGEMLISVHDEDLPVFNHLRTRTHLQAGDIESSKDVLIDLYAMDVEFSADALEEVYAELGHVSQSVLQTTLSDTEAADILASIAQAEHLNGRIRRNVMDTRRAISFLMRKKLLNNVQYEDARQIIQDINSLDGHTSFLFDKINFLMSATVGFININQNKIVRMFSVASVTLLPPMLIASIYGMNFRHMPELDWKIGYAFALGLMVLSVLLPFWIFHKKGWLK